MYSKIKIFRDFSEIANANFNRYLHAFSLHFLISEKYMSLHCLKLHVEF